MPAYVCTHGSLIGKFHLVRLDNFAAYHLVFTEYE